MKKRITPNHINTLQDREVFVFGSNMSGIHGAGGAMTALKFGAKMGQAVGIQGNSYGIPTKDFKTIRSLHPNVIGAYVTKFIEYAKLYPRLNFLVTEIGCGLAGYTPEQIAPLFKSAVDVENIHLPKRFWDVLLGKQEIF